MVTGRGAALDDGAQRHHLVRGVQGEGEQLLVHLVEAVGDRPAGRWS